MQGLVLHSFIDEIIDPEKFASQVKKDQEASILKPTFITELEEGLHQEIEGKVATYVVTSNESGKATVIVDGVKHDINSLEDIHKFEVDKKNCST
ncbi:hypothetical protein [Escherichia coli]|nr:hypothetical protein [Escherichia coli]ENB95136.1 hypothetical protein ECP029943811_2397 [Escherichia coli P0299438.11]ENB99469.1 hypothetical protein ECP02994383_2463 [Escherichia coli P0299438.3]ENC10989.1 hypothetical protein ECP02994385_2409 [Escherichia coli P0299438.5]ENC16209.1 hypothetical protein ECP02994386_2398 [Escherichia coli P0299438.6]ENC18354.1 hypothetical protein ECP02994387_2436 [Escherichia coli P0299438.7]ENC24761.1 hypothetical protein ECP02994388_2463 [Escherichia c